MAEEQVSWEEIPEFIKECDAALASVVELSSKGKPGWLDRADEEASDLLAYVVSFGCRDYRGELLCLDRAQAAMEFVRMKQGSLMTKVWR